MWDVACGKLSCVYPETMVHEPTLDPSPWLLTKSRCRETKPYSNIWISSATVDLLCHSGRSFINEAEKKQRVVDYQQMTVNDPLKECHYIHQFRKLRGCRLLSPTLRGGNRNDEACQTDDTSWLTDKCTHAFKTTETYQVDKLLCERVW